MIGGRRYAVSLYDEALSNTLLTITRDDGRSPDTNDRLILYSFFTAGPGIDGYTFFDVNSDTLTSHGFQAKSPASIDLPISPASLGDPGFPLPLTLSASPEVLSGGLTEQEVTFTVTLPEASNADVTVFIKPPYETHLSTPDSLIVIPAGETKAEVSIMLNAAFFTPGPRPTTFTVGHPANYSAYAAGYVSSNVRIPVTARDATDASGYRVVIASHADNAWVGKGSKKVKVEVIRVSNIAYSWTDFGSIIVSLHGTEADDPSDEDAVYNEILSLTAGNFDDDDGDLVFSKRSSASDADPFDSKNAITYESDKIIFQFGTNSGGIVEPQNDHKQYTGVYATARFSATGTFVLDSRDTDTETFDDPSILATIDEADRVVGDGKLIRMDLQAPKTAQLSVSAPMLTVGGKSVTAATKVKIGDKIDIAVGVGGGDNRFRHSGVQIQILSLNNTSGNTKGKTFFTKNFTAIEVINAASDSLRTSYEVTQGKIKVAALADGKTRDGEDIAEGATFEPDNLMIRARVREKDQAGNFSGNNARISPNFTVDSRAPGISVLYPNSGDPFTGDNEGTEHDEHLNPLKLRVDEPIDSLYVYPDGAADSMIVLMPSDRGMVVGEATVSVGDTTTYDTTTDGGKLSSMARGGKEIDLVVVAKDLVGNTGMVTISNVTHDEALPILTAWFPQTNLLDGDQINNVTRHPVFTLPEDVDSIAVRYDPSTGDDITEEVDGLSEMGEHQVAISDPFVQNTTYTMTIFVRDLAGNVFITPADSSANMKFNAQFDNPKANMFQVSTETDSVIAGQANILTIQAVDHDAPSNTSRNALTYKNRDEDDTMAAEVRISAWDMISGGVAESVWFEGKDVMDDADSPDGMGTLDANGWVLGKRTVRAKSNKAYDHVKIVVEHRNAGAGDTTVSKFDGAIDNLYVGAADFANFEITAWEEGIEGPAKEIWGSYTLRVVPVDRHNNPSVRAFKSDPSTAEDSLAVLDTRADNAFDYTNGIAVEIIGVPTIDDFALLVLNVEKMGANYDLVAPDDRRSQTVQVRVDNTSLQDGDTRSQNIRNSARFTISAPLTPMLTLWVPGSADDEAGNDVVIPADTGTITVTVAAEGFNAGNMVTFTQDDTAMDAVAANADGVAKLDITMSMAGSVTVSATNGVYSTDELTVVFVDVPPEPTRVSYATADGTPVYLIYAGDAPSDLEVGVDDFQVLLAALNSMKGDENYNIQADVDDDGDVDVDDFLVFVASYGLTAVGPASKPLVLLPGINENAEFSLRLGSGRIIPGEILAVDVALANVEALVGYGFAVNYDADKFEFISVAPASEDLLKSTGGETLLHHVVANGQITVVNGIYNGTAVSGGGDIVRLAFRVLQEFEENVRFEIADGLVFDPNQLQNLAVVAGVLEVQSTPTEFVLHQNFPNPFNPDTTIKYELAESANVTLQIYNVVGQVVRTLVGSEAQNAGRYQIRWNGMDDRGVPVSSGIYFYQISAGKFHAVQKLMLLK